MDRLLEMMKHQMRINQAQLVLNVTFIIWLLYLSFRSFR